VSSTRCSTRIRVLLDTNVLLDATGADHPLRAPCRSPRTALGEGRIDGYVTDVVVAEFLHARSRQVPRPEAIRMTRDLLKVVTRVVAVSAQGGVAPSPSTPRPTGSA
jgi:predicted nucleic acid-binding protein